MSSILSVGGPLKGEIPLRTERAERKKKSDKKGRAQARRRWRSRGVFGTDSCFVVMEWMCVHEERRRRQLPFRVVGCWKLINGENLELTLS